MKGRLSACCEESVRDSVRDETNPIGKQVHTEVIPIDDVTTRQASSRKWLDRHSLPLDIDRSLCAGNYSNQDVVSFECIERPVPPSTLEGNNHQVQASDDETVDLTEPWLESFCIANVNKSPS